MADGVAGGLVAGDDQQDEERRQLGLGELLAVDVRVDQCRRQVVGRLLHALLAERRHHLGQLGARRQQRNGDVAALGHVLGIGRTENDVRPGEHGVVVGLRDAHHVADDLQRQARRDLGDEVALALVDDVVDDLVGRDLHLVLEGLDHLRGERGRHDAAQPSVPRVVQVDHRPEELEEGLGHVQLAGGALARAEQLRLATRFEYVGVAGDGVVAGQFGELDRRGHHDLRRRHPSEGPLFAQRLERPFAVLERPSPEREVGEVDVVEGEGLVRFHCARSLRSGHQEREGIWPTTGTRPTG